MGDKIDTPIPEGSKIQDIDPDALYDLLILGAGPAGLTAAVYSMRKGLFTAMLTSNIGGQVMETASIENYMGYRFIEGTALVDKFFDQIQQFKISFKQDVKIISLREGNGAFSVDCSDGNSYRAKSIIVATGKSSRRLNVPGEREFTGKGVAYCAICDAPLYRGLKTAVVGGGNSAMESAIDLCKIAEEVHIIQNLPELTADKVLIEKLHEFNNFTIHYNSLLQEIKGDKLVTGVSVKNSDTGETFSLDVDGVFVSVGLIPNTDPVKGFLELNKYGEIVIDYDCRTSVGGVFAAGDVTSVSVKQIIVAAGEGAKAALNAHDYLLKS